MKKKLALLSSSIALFVLPITVFAQPTPQSILSRVLGTAQGLLWSVAIAYVIFSITFAGFKFLQSQGNPAKVDEARKALIWGIAGTTVVVLAWSMLAIVKYQLGV